MTWKAQRLDGVAAAADVQSRVRERVSALKARGITPGLAVVQVGGVAASNVYVKKKIETATSLGFHARRVHLEESAGFDQLLRSIDALNLDRSIHGFLVQSPLPQGWDEARAFRQADPSKDLDGFHPMNVGRTTLGEGGFWPGTAVGILELLRFHGVGLAGKHAVVVGRSRVVGRPCATLLSQRGVDATVTLCHTATLDLADHTRGADIVVMAAGVMRSLKGDMIREGAVVVDVGIHSVEDPARPGKRRLVGDVDEVSVSPRASWLSPVPGGVGPMTVAMLLQNAVTACERSHA